MIQLEQVTFGYGKVPLFEQLDLALVPGGIYGLLGLNGAGKTSLLKLMAGLRFPKKGSVRMLDQEPRRRRPGFLADLAFVPEVCYTPNLTLKRFVANYAPLYPRFDHVRYAGCLTEFGLTPDQNLSKLSHGQEKKATLSFALSCGARLILLDEPSNGLDIPSKSQLRRVLADAAQEDRVIIISTHQVRDLENLIDPVIVLHGGRVVFNQTMEAVSARLTCRAFPEDPSASPDVLFAEKRIGEWVGVFRSGHPADGGTPPELELLFNTVIHAPERIAEVFGKGARP